MGFLLTSGLALLLVYLLCYLDGQRREHALARDWELILTPRGAESYRLLGEQVRAQLELTELTCAAAGQEGQGGDVAKARRLGGAACELIEGFAMRMMRALAAIAVLSRMATAVAPVRPLRPRDFRLPQLVQLARVSRFLHHVLVTTAERFRLRVFLLQRGFRTVGALAFRRRQSSAFEDLDDLRHDVATLSDESLLAYRTLLISLEAEERT